MDIICNILILSHLFAFMFLDRTPNSVWLNREFDKSTVTRAEISFAVDLVHTSLEDWPMTWNLMIATRFSGSDVFSPKTRNTVGFLLRYDRSTSWRIVSWAIILSQLISVRYLVMGTRASSNSKGLNPSRSLQSSPGHPHRKKWAMCVTIHCWTLLRPCCWAMCGPNNLYQLKQ